MTTGRINQGTFVKFFFSLYVQFYSSSPTLKEIGRRYKTPSNIKFSFVFLINNTFIRKTESHLFSLFLYREGHHQTLSLSFLVSFAFSREPPPNSLVFQFITSQQRTLLCIIASHNDKVRRAALALGISGTSSR